LTIESTSAHHPSSQTRTLAFNLDDESWTKVVGKIAAHRRVACSTYLNARVVGHVDGFPCLIDDYREALARLRVSLAGPLQRKRPDDFASAREILTELASLTQWLAANHIFDPLGSIR
jgi:hypothetical protein